jgi:pimeloyl-ACP methyl ester carboxylesterase
MTRAQGPDSEIDFRSFGVLGGARTVLVLRTGAVALVDPGPGVTRHRDVRLLTVRLDDAELDDPPVFGGETPAESTADAVADLGRREAGGALIGVVADRSTASLAVALAARASDLVGRLALVGAEVPDEALVADLLGEELARIAAPTLVVGAADDPASAQWYAERLRSAEVELVAAPGLPDSWPQVLAHLAPVLE